MGKQYVVPFRTALAAAILLGGVALAQQGSALPPNGSQRPSEAVQEGRNPRPIGGRLRSWLPGRNHHESADASPEVEQPAPRSMDAPPPPQPEAPYLKELAAWLSVPIPENATPGDIAFAIRQALSETIRYSGDVFSEEEFTEYRTVFPATKDAETFEAYHTFIKKVAGKSIVIFEQ